MLLSTFLRPFRQVCYAFVMRQLFIAIELNGVSTDDGSRVEPCSALTEHRLEAGVGIGNQHRRPAWGEADQTRSASLFF